MTMEFLNERDGLSKRKLILIGSQKLRQSLRQTKLIKVGSIHKIGWLVAIKFFNSIFIHKYKKTILVE